MIGKWREQLDSKLRGQSEVLGVALLTAVVVILFATVALFLFTDFASEANDEQLLATVESDVTSQNITITHQGGDSFEPGNVSVILRGDTTYESKLADFSDPADDSSSFSPGDTWTDSNLTLAGEFRLLVIDEKSSTVLHDQTHEVKIEDVRLRVQDGQPGSGASYTTNDITMPGANNIAKPDVIRRNYLVQVKYNDGTGWQNQTGGTEALTVSSPLSQAGTNDEGGTLQAQKPTTPDGTAEVDLSIDTNTSSSAVDDDISSNVVTVTVVDVNFNVNSSISITADEGADDPNFNNKADIYWTLDSSSDYAPVVEVDIRVENKSNTPIPIEPVSGGSESDCTDTGTGTAECEVTFNNPNGTLTSGSGLPVIEADVTPDTEEVSVKVTPLPSAATYTNTASNSTDFDPARFVPDITGASFRDAPDEDIQTNLEVTNNGDWTDKRNIEVTATSETRNGADLGSLTVFDEQEVLTPGNSLGEGDLNASTIPITEGKTNETTIEVVTANSANSDSVTVDEMLPASFDFATDPTAQVVDNTLEVSYKLENTGNLTHEQSVNYLVEGTVVSTTTPEIAPGETPSQTMRTGDIPSAGWYTGEGTYEYTVDTGDSAQTNDIQIDGPEFSVSINNTQLNGNNIQVKYNVTNSGDLGDNINANATFVFLDENDNRLYKTAEQTPGLLVDGQTTETLVNATLIDDYRTDEIKITVFANRSGSVEDSAQETFSNVDPGQIELSITQKQPNPDGAGMMEIDYALENVGSLPRETSVNLSKTDFSGTFERLLANSSDVAFEGGPTSVPGGVTETGTLRGQLRNSDVRTDDSGSYVDIKVNATDDALPGSEQQTAVKLDPPSIEFNTINGETDWVEDGPNLTVDYEVENKGDAPTKPNRDVTFTATATSVDTVDPTPDGLLSSINTTLDSFGPSDTLNALDPGETSSGNFTDAQNLTITDVLNDSQLAGVKKLNITATLATANDTDNYDWQVNPPTYKPSIKNVTFKTGQELTAKWEVKNEGSYTLGKEEIRLYVNGNNVKTRDEKIENGNPYVNNSYSYKPVSSPVDCNGNGNGNGDADQVNFTVATDDATATKCADAPPQDFEFTSHNLKLDTADNGEPAKVNLTEWTVENTGEFPGNQSLRLVVDPDGEVSGSEDVTVLETAQLNPDETTSGGPVTVPVTESVVDEDDGKIFIELRTDNDTVSTSVDADKSFFNTSINTNTNNFTEAANPTDTATIDVGYSVENTGDFTDTQEIKLEVEVSPNDYQVRETQDITLVGGEKTSGTLTAEVSESDLDSSNNISVRISSKDDSSTGNMGSYTPGKLKITNHNFALDRPSSTSGSTSVEANSFVIKNIGQFTVNGEARLKVNSDVKADTSIDLAPGENTGSIGPLSHTPNSAGMKNLRLEAVKDRDGSYDSNTDSKKTTSYDLKAASLEFVGSNSLSFSDGTVEGSYKIKNTGDFVAKNDKVKLKTTWRLGSNPPTVEEIEDSNSFDLVPGAEKTGMFSPATAPDPGFNTDYGMLMTTPDDAYRENTEVDTAYFNITGASASFSPTNDPNALGEASVTFDIENTGDFSDEQPIKINPEKDPSVTTSVQVGAGETRTNIPVVTVTIDTIGTQAITLTPERGDADSAGIDVEGPNYEVQSITNWEYSPNTEQAELDFVIENTGDLEGSGQDITVKTDSSSAGGTETYPDTTIAPGNTFAKQDVSIGIDEAGSIDLVVSTGDDQCNPNLVRVDPPTDPGQACPEINLDYPDFQINIENYDSRIYPETGSPTTGTFNYNVTNTGDISDTQDIHFCVNPSFNFCSLFSEDDSTELTLGAGETSETLTFSDSPTRAEAPDNDYYLASDDDSWSQTVDVVVPPEFANIDITDNSQVDCDAGFFGIGFCFVPGIDQTYTVDYDISYSINDPSNIATDAEVEVVYRDGIHNDRTVTDPLNGDLNFSESAKSNGGSPPIEFFFQIRTSDSEIGTADPRAFTDSADGGGDPQELGIDTDALVEISLDDNSNGKGCNWYGTSCDKIKPKMEFEWDVLATASGVTVDELEAEMEKDGQSDSCNPFGTGDGSCTLDDYSKVNENPAQVIVSMFDQFGNELDIVFSGATNGQGETGIEDNSGFFG